MQQATALPTWADRFLTELADHGYITRAARTAGISATVVIRQRRTDRAFAVAVARALAEAPVPSGAREITCR
ncbi:hypothetical protein [Thermomonospora umbrina]|uniref:Uncharacterized protein n=1 Tax=Thermomonospora umbrina TaxID=111806 RepID=A0A3D9SSF7_9ACTN|nr:hypothetical protein [Thermomonospora umbrina]REE97400.1 hypothetical protein DFJ69_2868 [Thermomonospora umbrina]